MLYAKTKLSPPWVTLFNQIEALFDQDPEIDIEFINDPLTVKLYVENNEKAEALAALLPYQIDLGSTTLNINVIPSNTGLPFVGHLTFNKESQYMSSTSVDLLFQRAFKRNPILNTVCVIDAGTYNESILSEQFIDKNGRTILWRRFNQNNWAYERYGKLWSEALPDNERLTVNGEVYVHWYDCVSDHIF